MFQFRRFPSRTYLIQYGMTRSSRAAFPHSEIHGSKPICGSPWLIAACHVLLRLLMPRHPPCALLRLTSVKLENHASHSVTQNRSLPFYGFPQFLLLPLLPCLRFFLFRYSVFKVRQAPLRESVSFKNSPRRSESKRHSQLLRVGGPKWTRTTDLTIISRAL